MSLKSYAEPPRALWPQAYGQPDRPSDLSTPTEAGRHLLKVQTLSKNAHCTPEYFAYPKGAEMKVQTCHSVMPALLERCNLPQILRTVPFPQTYRYQLT